MKTVSKTLLCAVAAAALATGCAKAPTQEMTDAKSAVDASAASGAQVYAAAELEAVKARFAAAEAEVKAQEGVMFKKYDKAKELLAQAKAEADALAASIPARKEAARAAAAAVEAEAQAALAEAKDLLAQAPKGKGAQADLEAYQADLTGIEEAMAEVTSLVTAENYLEASAKAQALKEKAMAVSEAIRAAMAKISQ